MRFWICVTIDDNLNKYKSTEAGPEYKQFTEKLGRR